MHDNTYPGKFIVFEGLDGSGQTTQCDLLREYLEDKGMPVALTKEPTDDSSAGREILSVLNHEKKMDPKKLQELFAEDRREHLKNFIIPLLKKGEVVISDRYFFSSFAYGSLDADVLWLIDLNKDFILPDITFLLKVAPKVCAARIKKRGEEKTLFERDEILDKVWKTYETMPNRFKNFFVVNGEQSINKVFEEIKMLVNQYLLNG